MYKPEWWPKNPYPGTMTGNSFIDAVMNAAAHYAWDNASHKIQAALCEMLEERIVEYENEITAWQKERGRRYRPESPEFYRHLEICDNNVRTLRFEIHVIEEILMEIGGERVNNSMKH